MSTPGLAFGMPTCAFGLTDEATSLPSLNAVTVAASNLAWGTRNRNNTRSKLSGTYKVGIALMGMSALGGYAIDIMSALSADVTVASGEGILIRVAQADFPAGMIKAAAVAVFLKKGSADPQLAGYGYLDDSGADFAYMLRTEPPAGAPRFTAGVLTAATTSGILDDRAPFGVAWTNKTNFTGNFEITHSKQKANFRPATSIDSEIPMGGADGLRFSIYSRSLADLVDVVGGDYVKFTDTNDDTVELLDSSPNIIASTLDGNRPVKIFRPADSQGRAVTQLLLGSTIVSTADVVQTFQKDEIFKLDIELQALALDPLTQYFEQTLYYSRYS